MNPLRALRALALALVSLAASACALISPPSGPHPGSPAPVTLAAAPPGPLLAGAWVEDVTPGAPAFMAGFGVHKRHQATDGAITVRALALRRGARTVALVACDLIGLHEYQVEEVRRRLRGLLAPDALLVACTHTHAGPDTLGMWGLPPLFSGLDPEVTERVLAGIARAVEEALLRLEPVRVRWGRAEAPPVGISKNRREPARIDRRLTALAFDRPDGRAVATLVHFACHPETLGSKNTTLSPDFPGALRQRVERERGGVCVFLNGALGGMVTVDRQGEPSLAEAARIGTALGDLALGALAAGQPFPAELGLSYARAPLLLPVESRRYHLGDLFGIFGPRPFVDGGYTPSEVWALRLGPAVFLTVPGEALPKLGFELGSLASGAPRLIVGLGNDELGYLVHESDWEDERYAYERSVSPGRSAVGVIRAGARAALAALGALRPGG
ncbi:MAG: neutral/alkaline non-lysosomal ceramidase N-terminal domain-containing protein [Planctomycetota bacterium]